MKRIKSLALVLVLGMITAIYALGATQNQPQSCDTGDKAGCCATDAAASCCKEGAECCKTGAECCKAGAECCKKGAECCKSGSQECMTDGSCCAAHHGTGGSD